MTIAGVFSQIGAALLVVQDGAAALGGNAVSAAAHWAPPIVTTAALLAAITIIVKMVGKRFDKMETTLEVVRDTMPALATKTELETMRTDTRREFETMREQTRASMRSMGDGFDARITKVAERCAVVENDLGKEIAVRQALRDGK